MNKSTDAASLTGKVFNEMYRIVRQIGTGGMGAVYEAVHTRLQNKRFAIKMLHASIAQDAEVFQRFRREAEIATELGHPNIVEVTDFNITPDGAPYMVMELLDGEDLASRLQKRGPLPLEIMARMVAEVCSALDAAHGAGIVHRDLKPQNIFLCKKLGRDDFVKIVDFGISKVKDSSSVVTRDHSLMGTPFYMSPEQADGLVQQIDNRTDIFAMGAIMWEMLTGRMAFEAPTISGAMYKVVHVDPYEVHLVRPDVPPTVSLVLRRAMAKEKELRYGSVLELSHEFGNACRGIPPQYMPPPLRGQTASMAPVAQVPRPQTPPPQRAATGQDAYAATGYVTPAPGQPLPAQIPPTNYPQQPQGYPHQQYPQQGYPPQPMPQQGSQPFQQPFPATAAPLSNPHMPQQGQPQPFQQFPPTAMPQQPQQFMTPPQQQFVPQQQFAPQQPQMMGTPPPGMMVQPGMPPMSHPPSTLSAAAGQQVMTQPTGQKKGKGVLIGAIAGVVVLGAVAAVVVPKLTAKPADKVVTTNDGDKKGPDVIEGGDKVVIPPDAAPVAVAAPPDAAPVVEKVVDPVPPKVEYVEIAFEVGFDKAPKNGGTAKISVNGKPIEGTTYKAKKGDTKLKVEISFNGYKTDSQWVVPDGDRKLKVTLKKKAAGGSGPGVGWVP